MLELVLLALFILIASVCGVIYLLYTQGASSRPAEVPGPAPVNQEEGNVPDIKAAGSLHQFLSKIHKQYGPITSFFMGTQRVISIASPELFKQQAKVFDRPASLFRMFEPILGEFSIQYANGSEGRYRHSAYSRCFSDGNIKHFYHLLASNAQNIVSAWSKEAPDTHLPLSKYTFSFAIRSVLKSAFGAYFDDDQKVLKLKEAYDVCWADMERRLFGDFPEPGSSRELHFEKHRKEIKDIMQDVMDERKNNPPDLSEQLLIDTLISLDITEEAKNCDMNSFLVAGIHTTGLLLTWSLYFLATHQDIQDRVYNELVSELGEEDISAENAGKVKYTRQVLDETMRCSTLGPYAARVREVDVQLGGHTIPANTPVLQALGVLLQDSTLYPEPEKFDPERFSSENVKARPSFSFEPFGFAGKRTCPGYKLTLAGAPVFLATVLREFRVDIVPGQVVTPVYGLVTKPEEEIWVTVAPRK